MTRARCLPGPTQVTVDCVATFPHFEILPDGRVTDLRYRHCRGEQVRITGVEYSGLVGTVDSRVFQDSVDHPVERAPGYHMILDSGLVITLRGDQVERRSAAGGIASRGNYYPIPIE